MGEPDLIIAAIVLVVASLALFAAGYRTACRASRAITDGLIVGTIVLLAMFMVYVQDAPLLASLVPWSGAVLVTRVCLPLASLLAGLIAGRSALPRWRRAFFVSLLLPAAIYATVWPLLGATPPTLDVWSGPVCIQTTDATCGPAAVATLLAQHDIHSDETAMTAAALTHGYGTSFLGLYRALALATPGSVWRPQPFTGDLDALRREPRPVLINVALDRDDAEVDPRYVEDWGWTPGLTHTIVLMRFTEDGRVIVADPQVGLETWSLEGLSTLYQGRGLRLVPR